MLPNQTTGSGNKIVKVSHDCSTLDRQVFSAIISKYVPQKEKAKISKVRNIKVSSVIGLFFSHIIGLTLSVHILASCRHQAYFYRYEQQLLNRHESKSRYKS